MFSVTIQSVMYIIIRPAFSYAGSRADYPSVAAKGLRGCMPHEGITFSFRFNFVRV
jgi:hypothetical protein